MHQFTLAAPRDQRITLCTYFPVRDKLPPWIRLISGDGTFTGFLRNLRREIESGEVDVIHAHSPHLGAFCLVARALIRAPFPPTVFTVHNSYPSFRLRNRLLLLPVFAGFQQVVCCGAASFESFPALYRRIAGERLRSVQNGIDLDRIDRILSAPGAHREHPFTVIGVSRLVKIKNVPVVLEAFLKAQSGDERLVLVGTGDQYDTIRRRIAASTAAERIELAGLIAREAVYRRLRNADLFVSASRGEGLPIAVLEAMSCACPVVLSDIPPHREIAHGTDFVPLIRPDDVDGFAREIRRFRSMPPDQRARIGEKCRHLVETRFGLERMHREYRSVFEAALAKRNGAATHPGRSPIHAET